MKKSISVGQMSPMKLRLRRRLMCSWIYFRDGFVNRNIPKTKKAVINTTSLLSTETLKKKRDEDCAKN